MRLLAPLHWYVLLPIFVFALGLRLWVGMQVIYPSAYEAGVLLSANTLMTSGVLSSPSATTFIGASALGASALGSSTLGVGAGILPGHALLAPLMYSVLLHLTTSSIHLLLLGAFLGALATLLVAILGIRSGLTRFQATLAALLYAGASGALSSSATFDGTVVAVLLALTTLILVRSHSVRARSLTPVLLGLTFLAHPATALVTALVLWFALRKPLVSVASEVLTSDTIDEVATSDANFEAPHKLESLDASETAVLESNPDADLAITSEVSTEDSAALSDVTGTVHAAETDPIADSLMEDGADIEAEAPVPEAFSAKPKRTHVDAYDYRAASVPYSARTFIALFILTALPYFLFNLSLSPAVWFGHTLAQVGAATSSDLFAFPTPLFSLGLEARLASLFLSLRALLFAMCLLLVFGLLALVRPSWRGEGTLLGVGLGGLLAVAYGFLIPTNTDLPLRALALPLALLCLLAASTDVSSRRLWIGLVLMHLLLSGAVAGQARSEVMAARFAQTSALLAQSGAKVGVVATNLPLEIAYGLKRPTVPLPASASDAVIRDLCRNYGVTHLAVWGAWPLTIKVPLDSTFTILTITCP